MIQMYKPNLGTEEIEALSQVISSGYIGLGPKSDEFETAFARYIGASFAIGLSSHTAAIDLAMKLLEIGPGDEVIVPTASFLSTAHCVAHNGATPVFADIEPNTLALDPEDVARKITPRTRAVIAFHSFGRPCDIDRLRWISRPRGIRIIEDVADACGAEYKGAKLGKLGDLACFSFHPTKQLAMGDGGALTTDDAELADRARRLRWLGVDSDTWRTDEEEDRSGLRHYQVSEISLKCHMNDLMAAIGLTQLNKLDQDNARRREIARIYGQGLAELREVQLPPLSVGTVQAAWHTFPILCDRRDSLSAWLLQQGIATEGQHTPLHTYTCYGNRPSLPAAEWMAQKILALPTHPDLSDVEVFKVVNAIKAFYIKDRPRFVAGAERPHEIKAT